MDIDKQLLIECKTVIPKVGTDCAHTLQSYMRWYQTACEEGEDIALTYELWLRKSLREARLTLAEVKWGLFSPNNLV